MGNFTFSEIMTILIVILIVFGPNRLPEMARRVGRWVAKARTAAVAMRDEFVTEYQDAVEPIAEVRDELKAARDDLRGEVKAFGEDVKEVADETAADAQRMADETRADMKRLDLSNLAEARRDNTESDDVAHEESAASTDGDDAEPPAEESA